MSEPQEQSNAEAQEVLQHSELTARLLRRLTVSPGVIDAQTLRQFAARLAGGTTRTLSLLDDLMARYGIDDRLKIESPSLLMEQPWMMNINAYLTSYNSFSSTTNQFISSALTPQAQSSTAHSSTFLLSNTHSTEQTSSQPSQSSANSINSSLRATGHAANSRPESPDTNRRVQRHEARSVLDETTSLPLPAGKFRVSRGSARRGREKPSAEAQEVARNPAPKSSEDSNASTPTAAASTIPAAAAPRIAAGKIEEGQIESAKTIASADASADTTPTELLLARTRIAQSQIQRQSLDESVKVSQPTTAKIREARGSLQPAEANQPPAPAAAPVAPGLIEPAGETKTADSFSPMPERVGLPHQASEAEATAQVSKPAAPTETSTPLPLVKKLNASLPVQKRPPDFIWRQGADSSTMKDVAATILSADSLQSLNRAAGGASPVQQQHSQTFTPEAARRKDETQAGSGISTERILRNISRKLLIERERRGY